MAAFRHQIVSGAATVARSAVEGLFPVRCAKCGRRGYFVCPDCEVDIAPIEAPLCSRCVSPASVGCRCDRLDNALDTVRSAVWYEGCPRREIVLFKYESESVRSAHLAALAAD